MFVLFSEGSSPVAKHSKNVEKALKAKMSPDHLSAEEGNEWFDALFDKMGERQPSADAFFEERRQSGLGVGLSKGGKFVRQNSS